MDFAPVEKVVMQSPIRQLMFGNKIIWCLLSTLLTSNAFAQPIPENQFFESNGVTIRYIEVGSGTPVIAMHGLTQNSDTFLESILELAEDHRLILFDLRGHGLSDKPHSVSGYGREMADDVIRLMDHLKIPKAHILGYSIGVAPIAMAITEHENRFISAVFGGGAAKFNWGSDTDLLNQHRYQRILNSPRQRQLESSWEGQDQIALANLRLAEKELIVSKEQFSKLSIPILSILGSEDPAIGAVTAMNSVVPAMQLNLIAGESHVSAPGNSEFVRSIQVFFLNSERE